MAYYVVVVTSHAQSKTARNSTKRGTRLCKSQQKQRKPTTLLKISNNRSRGGIFLNNSNKFKSFKKMENKEYNTYVTKNEKRYQVHEVRNTPFHILEDNENFKIIVGNQIATAKTFKTKEDAVKFIRKKPYELIFTTCYIIIDKMREKEYLEQFKTAEQ